MNIINKRKHYKYNTDYSHIEKLKLAKLISIFLKEKENISTKDLKDLIEYFYDYETEDKDYVDYLNQKKRYRL